jgi:hypothetical protein
MVLVPLGPNTRGANEIDLSMFEFCIPTKSTIVPDADGAEVKEFRNDCSTAPCTGNLI